MCARRRGIKFFRRAARVFLLLLLLFSHFARKEIERMPAIAYSRGDKLFQDYFLDYARSAPTDTHSSI